VTCSHTVCADCIVLTVEINLDFWTEGPIREGGLVEGVCLRERSM